MRNDPVSGSFLIRVMPSSSHGGRSKGEDVWLARSPHCLGIYSGTWAPLLVAGLLLGSVIAVACGDDDRNAAVVEPEPATSETAGGDEASAVAVAAPSEADKSKETPPAVADAPADEPAAIEPVEESVLSPAAKGERAEPAAQSTRRGVDYFPEKVSVAHAKEF